MGWSDKDLVRFMFCQSPIEPAIERKPFGKIHGVPKPDQISVVEIIAFLVLYK